MATHATALLHSPGRLDRILRFTLLGLILAFLFVASEAFRENVFDVGDRAPDFTIRTDDGRTITPRNFGGRLLVLNFWATWCPPCIEELPSLNALAATMRDRGVVVLAISVDTDEKAYASFIRRVRPAFLTARDPTAEIPARFGTFKWPETYVIDTQGKVVQKHIGPRDWLDPAIVNSLRALL